MDTRGKLSALVFYVRPDAEGRKMGGKSGKEGGMEWNGMRVRRSLGDSETIIFCVNEV